MTCSEFEPRLDEFMDDTLSSTQMSALQAHADSCPHCAEQLRIARQMTALFNEMLPEIDVPLEVQAGWRRAIRNETRKRTHWLRYVASIAAVFAVLGVSFMAVRKPSDTPVNAAAVNLADAWIVNASESAVLEKDGAMAAGEADAQADGIPMREYNMTVEDLDASIAQISDLAVEYEASVDAQRFESEGVPCANIYIGLPSDNLTDFLSAASYLDVAGTMNDTFDAADKGEITLMLVLRTT